MTEKEKEKKTEEKKAASSYLPMFPQRMLRVVADEIANMVVNRLGYLMPARKPKSRASVTKNSEKAVFLDTSAIIDGRIFEVVKLGLLQDTFVVLEDILLELKHIADSQDVVKRERGRKGLEMLEALKKTKGVKVVIIPGERDKKIKEVDEVLIRTAKINKGRVVTCDYNLEKKASIEGVIAVNVNALANCLKVTAVPGEALHIKVLHTGKDVTQGVGYLDDGTMIVIESGAPDVGNTVDVVVSRVIQTSAGRILFAKKI